MVSQASHGPTVYSAHGQSLLGTHTTDASIAVLKVRDLKSTSAMRCARHVPFKTTATTEILGGQSRTDRPDKSPRCHHHTGGWIIEALHQCHDLKKLHVQTRRDERGVRTGPTLRPGRTPRRGGLARAGLAHHGHLLPTLHGEGQTVQNLHFRACLERRTSVVRPGPCCSDAQGPNGGFCSCSEPMSRGCSYRH